LAVFFYFWRYIRTLGLHGAGGHSVVMRSVSVDAIYVKSLSVKGVIMHDLDLHCLVVYSLAYTVKNRHAFLKTQQDCDPVTG
jgi:hypothetical protein